MSNPWSVDFQERRALREAEQVPLAHLSIELGHLYFEEFAGGFDALLQHFGRVAPWVDAVVRANADRVAPARPRISTCFLIDDYFTRFSSPAEVVPKLLKAAEAHGLTIDYVARESACAEANGVPLAELVLSRLVPDPEPGSTGVRPPTTVTGWLCNGQRSPQPINGQAMSPNRQWRPPAENGANIHSIFLDVELWTEQSGGRLWSCPYLAAIWQLLRLGVLRHGSSPIAPPVTVDQMPDDWDRLPAVVKVNPKAQPFAAYRSFSVLAPRFLAVEHAVRTILQQVSVEQVVADQVRTRSEGEGLTIPDELWQRIEYLFAN